MSNETAKADANAARQRELDQADAAERARLHAQRVRRTQQALVDIPGLDELLDLFKLPGSGAAAEGRSSAQTESRPPADLDVLDLRDRRTKTDDPRTKAGPDLLAWSWRDGREHWVEEIGRRRQGILPTLTSWVRDIDEHLVDTARYTSPYSRPSCCGACTVGWVGPSDVIGCCVGPLRDHPWQPRTVARECAYLLEHHDWMAEQPQFDEYATDLLAIHHDLARAVHEPLHATRYTCAKPGCGWDVVAMDNASWYRCTGCDSAWTEVELHRMAERRRPKPLTECAAIAEVSVRSLRSAIAEKRLRSVGRDGNFDLFDLEDVLEVAARIRLGRSAGSRRMSA